jgi:hypothetical protein
MENPKLSPDDVNWIVNQFHDFYNNIEDITDYYLKKKQEKISNQTSVFSSEEYLFNDYTVDPRDLKIDIEIITAKVFNELVTPIATFPVESQIGRRLIYGIKETQSNKYLGFIRLASPISAIKPRNDYFGQSLPLKKINEVIYNGQTIVPVQPFGYNYLGGKLMALMCVSNEVREHFNSLYNSNILLFETTSLYGSTKSMSMYDGLEPYLKYRGNTSAKSVIFPTDEVYYPIRNLYREKVMDGVVDYYTMETTSPKLKEFNGIISEIKNHLRIYNPESVKPFGNFIREKASHTQQKRFYMSNFGFENVKEHLVNNSPLKHGNFMKYEKNNLIEWWRKKATNRWLRLREEDKLRPNLELFTLETLNNVNFDIIR